jgi:succinate dehydrogenase / fumarate reductase cytochrome b subunit
MSEQVNKSLLSNTASWFDPRARQVGYGAYILNRITALGLTLYLFLHLIILGQLAIGPDAYQPFLHLIHNPIFIFGEFLVVCAGIIHGLNGIRIGLNSFGIGVPYQKQLFYALMVIAIVVIVYFAIRMFMG